MDKSLRYNQGKIDWTYIDFDSLIPMVEVLEYGANKYTVKDKDDKIITTGRDNWKKPTDLDLILKSLMRHVIDLTNNKQVDKESQKLTIGHILTNAMFYSYHLNK